MGTSSEPGDRSRAPFATAALRLARCAATTAGLLARRRVHQPAEHRGDVLHFADGTAATVFRETVVERPPTAAPCVLVVCFRLRGIHGDAAHRLFRRESVLNTVLFAGFPGFVSKLWLAHDGEGRYRGVYEWDGPLLAEEYARALWWVLALVGPTRSTHHVILPGLRRDDLLHDPTIAPVPLGDERAWWRLSERTTR